jgi:hypothetical protein
MMGCALGYVESNVAWAEKASGSSVLYGTVSCGTCTPAYQIGPDSHLDTTTAFSFTSFPAAVIHAFMYTLQGQFASFSCACRCYESTLQSRHQLPEHTCVISNTLGQHLALPCQHTRCLLSPAVATVTTTKALLGSNLMYIFPSSVTKGYKSDPCQEVSLFTTHTCAP